MSRMRVLTRSRMLGVFGLSLALGVRALTAQGFTLPDEIAAAPPQSAPVPPSSKAVPQAALSASKNSPSQPSATAAPASETTPPTVGELSIAAIDGEQLVAIVGRDPVLLADVRPRAEQMLKQMVGKETVPEEELQKAREMLIRRVLVEYINMKIVYRGFIESIVGSQTQEKAYDVEQQVRARARKHFYENEITRQLKDRNLTDINELDRELRKTGTNIDRLERQFIEAMAGSSFMNEQIPKDVPVTPVQLLDYYRDHGEEFDKPARAKWEQLSVLFSKFDSKEEAYAQIIAMGNEALFGGNLQAVAKKLSQEPLADKGGVHDWTRKGSLRSKVLDAAIFSLPLDKMSEVLTDDVGYHILRVTAREEAGRTPFSLAQEEIKEKIQDKKREEMHMKLVTKIRAAVPVWSMYPQDIPGALPLSEVAAVPNLNLKK